jgi:hypothetical protein
MEVTWNLQHLAFRKALASKVHPIILILKIAVVCSSETSIRTKTTRQLHPEDHTVNIHPYENPTSYVLTDTRRFLSHPFLPSIRRYNILSPTHGAEPFLRSRQLCSYSRSSQHFIEPEVSLPCSQETSTGPYPEPDQSSSYHPILSL